MKNFNQDIATFVHNDLIMLLLYTGRSSDHTITKMTSFCNVHDCVRITEFMTFCLTNFQKKLITFTRPEGDCMRW